MEWFLAIFYLFFLMYPLMPFGGSVLDGDDYKYNDLSIFIAIVHISMIIIGIVLCFEDETMNAGLGMIFFTPFITSFMTYHNESNESSKEKKRNEQKFKIKKQQEEKLEPFVDVLSNVQEKKRKKELPYDIIEE